MEVLTALAFFQLTHVLEVQFFVDSCIFWLLGKVDLD